MSKKDKIVEIIEYLSHHSYIETAFHFKILVATLDQLIKQYNARISDPVFRFCPHNFNSIEILHKIGIEYQTTCSKCGLTLGASRIDIIKEYPNAVIALKVMDCIREACDFCQ